MQDFVVALGLVLMIEGVLYALLPETMLKMVLALVETPAGQLRMIGLAAASAGLFLVWLVRG